jgi:uncharacterized protein
VQLRRFDDPAEYYHHVMPFLLSHEAEHNLPLGIVTTLLKTDDRPFPPYLACVEDAGEIVGVAMRTLHNVVLSEMTDAAALNLIADDLHTLYSELPGVNGSKVLSEGFAESWQSVSDQRYHLARQLRIYRLETVQPVTDVSGEYCKAAETDRELLIEWVMAFGAEALDGTSREEAEQGVDLRLASSPDFRGLRLWWDAGKPVSFAGYGGPTPNGIRIGPVYTPPEYRGRGYASACVAALSQELLDSGRKFCFLFTDLSNPTSNHIYQNIGYEPVSDVDEYRFEEKSERGV